MLEFLSNHATTVYMSRPTTTTKENNKLKKNYIFFFPGQRNCVNSMLARIILIFAKHDFYCSVGRALNTFLTTASIFNF